MFGAELQKHFQNEADWIAGLNKKALQDGFITSQRVEGLQKWITPAAE